MHTDDDQHLKDDGQPQQTVPQQACGPAPEPMDFNSAMQIAYILDRHQHAFFPITAVDGPQQPVPEAPQGPSQEPMNASTTLSNHSEPSPGAGSPISNKDSKLLPPDPHAAAFLESVLGPTKWGAFSAKLFERRLGGGTATKPRSRKRGKEGAAADEKKADSRSHGATVIEFLVKTEVVKEVLRTFVPHPYNPLKSLVHHFDGSPTGTVVITRPAILQLCGWSNTQFSYWARRAEAIACLSQYDERLAKLRAILEARMGHGRYALNSLNEGGIDVEEDFVTGKGIDAIVEEVKKRTGASQFIRGKHASLDPFGKILGDDFAHGLGNLEHGLQTARQIPTHRTGGGIRITDIRKRTAEAKERGEPVPLEYVLAEEEATRVAAAKAAGRGKRGPGKSRGAAGGDKHGMGSAQDELQAALAMNTLQIRASLQAQAVPGPGPSTQAYTASTTNPSAINSSFDVNVFGPQPPSIDTDLQEPVPLGTPYGQGSEYASSNIAYPPSSGLSYDMSLHSMGLPIPPMPPQYSDPVRQQSDAVANLVHTFNQEAQAAISHPSEQSPTSPSYHKRPTPPEPEPSPRRSKRLRGSDVT